MQRIASTGIFLGPDDLDTVQSALFVAEAAARAALGDDDALADLFAGEGNAREYLARMMAFRAQLHAERAR